MANNTVYANNVAGTLAAGVGPSDTILLLGAGQGALFPSPSGGDWFWLTVVHQSSGAVEVMQCTARSVDSLTVVRGRDGTTAISMTTGSVVEMRLCAIMMREVDYRTVRGVANGLASLDGTGVVPDTQIPAGIARDAEVAATYIPLAQRAAANGVATLDGSGLIPDAQIPAGIARDAEVAATYIPLAQRAAANGVATLDGSTKIPVAQIPDLSATYATKVNPTTSGTHLHVGVGTNAGDFTVHDGDLRTYRFGGDTGVLYLNVGKTRYLYWDNTYYQFEGAPCRGPNFIATSDRRMKTRIRRHKVKRGVADAIQLHDWDWKRSTTIKGGGSGVIAQQVLDYAPHHVQGGDSLGVDKAGLALEGVVDLAARMRELEKVIHGSANDRTRPVVSRSRRASR